MAGRPSASQVIPALVAIVTRLRSDVQAALQSVSIAEAFDRRASDALSQMTDREAAAKFMTDYVLLRDGEPSREALAVFVRDHFIGRDQADLLALVSAMGSADIERTFEIAAETTKPYEIAVALALASTSISARNPSTPSRAMTR